MVLAFCIQGMASPYPEVLTVTAQHMYWVMQGIGK